MASVQHQCSYPELEQLASTMPTPNVDSVRTQSRMSISNSKGLLNKPGQNNCFLNSAVQVLWHLDVFRRSFRELTGHACMGESCIFCALKELFNEFQYSTETTLPPDSLRFALAEAFSDQRRFQLGFMDDAAECFENILFRIHYHITNKETESSSKCLPHCIPHQKFAMNLYEQIICHSCGATTEPFLFSQMVHYTSTSALCVQGKQWKCTEGKSVSFGTLLKLASSMGDVRNCPKQCGTRLNIKKILVNRPDIISIGLVWDSEHPTLAMIRNVFQLIETSIQLRDVFELNTPHSHLQLNLVGLVTYYGKHYSTYLYHSSQSQWVYFDDATVRTVGPHWQLVVDKCVKGHFQPLLLLYSNPNGTVVDTRLASSAIVPMGVVKKPEKARPAPVTTGVGSLQRFVPKVNSAEVCSKLNPTIGQRIAEYNQIKYYSDVPDSPSATSTTSYFSDIGTDSLDNYINRKTVANIMKIQSSKPEDSARLSARNSSSSLESFESRPPIPAKNGVNLKNLVCSLQRRDSGNSSGDRSSSVASMDPPYYRRSLKCVKQANKNSDQGYDSFSVSSSDSYPSNAVSPSKLSKLKQIPENAQDSGAISECDQLCLEADRLLLRSQEKEREGDLRAAAALSDSAATKARIAMDIPYSNHQNLILAKMKHSMCVMRSANLHKRVLEMEVEEKRILKAEYHHSRQSSRDSGKHVRQGSKDGKDSKGIRDGKSPSRSSNVEIYATLPKKVKRKHLLKNSTDNLSMDDAARTPPKPREPLSNKSPPEAPPEVKGRESDFSDYYSEWEGIKRSQTKQPVANGWQSCRENESEAYGEVGSNTRPTAKKQCKVKRKLLLGNLLKLKNRSLPDLREDALVDSKEGKELAETNKSRCSVASINTKGFQQSHRPPTGQVKPTLVKVLPPLVSHKVDSNKELYQNVKECLENRRNEAEQAEQANNVASNPFLQELNQKRNQILNSGNHLRSKDSVNELPPLPLPLPPPPPPRIETETNGVKSVKKPTPREIVSFITAQNSTLERKPQVANRNEDCLPVAQFSRMAIAKPPSTIQVPIPVHHPYPPRNMPPDYATAIRRLERNISDKSSARFPSPPPVSSNIYANMMAIESPPEYPRIPNTTWDTVDTLPVINRNNSLTKRASIVKKKSVKFSDQIELVACAEPEEHLPNPLFEKVLGKNFLYTLQ